MVKYDQISAERGTPAKLWQSLSKILRRDKELDSSSASPTHSADQFIQFFCHKVETIRKDTENCPPPPPASLRPAIASLTELKTCTEDEVRRVILSMYTKSCTTSDDPIPTFLLKESVDVLLPYTTVMINASLHEGHLPASRKHAILTPLLTKPYLDAGDFKNYCPVSKLVFMSKFADKVVIENLVSHLQEQLRRPCLFQLRQLWMVRSSLTLKAAKTLVHAFVSSRLDYCNSLLYGIGDGLLMKLQTVQNAAARVVTGTKKFDHITPVLRQLHWLPVCQRITFKLAMITFKCIHGLAPSYLADVCTVSSVVGRWQLRLVNSGGTRRVAHKDQDWSEGLCHGWPGHLEQPLRRPADFITVQRYICAKTQNPFIWLPAILRSSLIGCYTN